MSGIQLIIRRRDPRYRFGLTLVEDREGVKVIGVQRHSGAEASGILRGDIILSVDGERVNGSIMRRLRRTRKREIKVRVQSSGILRQPQRKPVASVSAERVKGAKLWGFEVAQGPAQRPIVTVVKESSPAAAAGFERGDMIIRLDGCPGIPTKTDIDHSMLDRRCHQLHMTVARRYHWAIEAEKYLTEKSINTEVSCNGLTVNHLLFEGKDIYDKTSKHKYLNPDDSSDSDDTWDVDGYIEVESC